MVFAPTGEFLCRLPPMPGHSLAEAGPDYLLLVHLDELDVPTVVVHSFAPPTAGRDDAVAGRPPRASRRLH